MQAVAPAPRDPIGSISRMWLKLEACTETRTLGSHSVCSLVNSHVLWRARASGWPRAYESITPFWRSRTRQLTWPEPAVGLRHSCTSTPANPSPTDVEMSRAARGARLPLCGLGFLDSCAGLCRISISDLELIEEVAYGLVSGWGGHGGRADEMSQLW